MIDNLHPSTLKHKYMMKEVAISPREVVKSDSGTDV